jgi:hypothetical protein
MFRERRTIKALSYRFGLYLIPLFYLLNRSTYSIKIKKTHYQKKELNDELLIQRLFLFYKNMKSISVNDGFISSSLWEKHLSESYSDLEKALFYNDIDRFHFFLENFGSWRTYTGIENSSMIYEMNKNPLKRVYLKRIFYSYLKIWTAVSKDKDISRLSYPGFGNQSGAYIGNNFVGIGSFFSDYYGNFLKSTVEHFDRPVVCEIGGGYGKLAYFTLRDLSKSVYIDFDLPEVLCLAAYYLMKCWPDKRVLLFGEGDLNSESVNNFDLIFMPPSEIEKMPNDSVELLINTTSLGEMPAEVANCYITHVNRIARNFFSMNHEYFRNEFAQKSSSLLGSEYAIDLDRFKLVFYYPDLAHMLSGGKINLSSDIFIRYYTHRL